MYNSEKHHRRSIRLPSYDYSRPGFYFVTICAWQKECLFGAVHNNCMNLNTYGMIAHKIWTSLPKHFKRVVLDEFVVMPNHVHGILEIRNNGAERAIQDREIRESAIRELPLQEETHAPRHLIRRRMIVPKIAGYFKMNTAKQINHIRKDHGMPIWQRNYYDHIIRNEIELNSIREYIRNNPVNWINDDYYAS